MEVSKIKNEDMETYKLKAKYFIQGEIRALSGLAIGGTFSPMSIGAPDSTVVRNPLTNKPYIPGSSLKGKMRSLLEQRDGKIGRTSMGAVQHGPYLNLDGISARLFGLADGSRARPSRLIVHDGELLGGDDQFSHTDLPYTEVKTEVVLDRVTSKAVPRQIERVPSGACFPLNMVLNVFDGEVASSQNVELRADDSVELIKAMLEGLELLQDDYLGGKGSRGSGQIKIVIKSIIERTAGYYRGEVPEKDITNNLPGGIIIPSALCFDESNPR